MKQTGIVVNRKAAEFQAATQNCWFDTKISAITKRIIREKWFVDEVIHPQKILNCEIIEHNGCMRLYNDKDKFFCMDGEQIGDEACKIDFFSAEKIMLIQRNETTSDRSAEKFELTSLWPKRQLVVAARHESKQLLAFAPIFVVRNSKWQPTADKKCFFDFATEFIIICDYIRKDPGNAASSDALAVMENSKKLLFWLKDHCY